MSAPTLRIATFNVENLMERFDFSGWDNDRRMDRAIALKDVPDEEAYQLIEMARTVASEDDARQMTALALAAVHADVVCLQEVENLDALEAFERKYLRRMTGIEYPHKVWREGNDRRGIDVALVARAATPDGSPIEVKRVTSHHDMRYGAAGLHNDDLLARDLHPKERIFRRNCLEVDLRVGGKPLTVYTSHFKAMGSARDGMNGRDYTRPIRTAEASAVRKIIEDRFGERAARMNWVIAGDLNDYTERQALTGPEPQMVWEDERPSGLAPLLDGFAVNLMDRRPRDDRWTVYHANGPVEDLSQPWERPVRHLVQLDYLLASPALAEANPDAVPDIHRSGLPHRVPFVGERHPRIGWDRPKASDHCPVAVTLQMV